MVMRSYIFDTNLISAVINNQEPVVTKMKTVIDKGEKLYLSVITDYEIRRGLFATQATRKLKVYEMLRGQFELLWIDSLELSTQAAEIHADLRRKGTPIQDADILIAATALIHQLTIVTADSDFLRVPNLTVENWLQG
jgi:tRNA(fMet)-specific endonuclease VapC